MQAFLVYSAAVVSADPSRTLELLAYALTVIRASQNFDGLHWQAYDTQLSYQRSSLGKPVVVQSGYRPIHPFLHPLHVL